jgi:hypothetical protein
MNALCIGKLPPYLPLRRFISLQTNNKYEKKQIDTHDALAGLVTGPGFTFFL